MLRYTFIHIPGIGLKTEQQLWKKGILTWDDFLQKRETVFSPMRDSYIKMELENSLKNMDDIRFFKERLTSEEMWRLYRDFQKNAVFLDIETSGGYQGTNEITIIGIYDGSEVKTFINGENLNEFEFIISDYDLVITFSGSSFDLPIIRRTFPNITLPKAHIDLRFLLKRLGYGGGLKKIEQKLGIQRDSNIEGMTGYHAVLLWKAFQWGDYDALKRLIEYNKADIVNLKPLMEFAYNQMKGRLMGSLND